MGQRYCTQLGGSKNLADLKDTIGTANDILLDLEGDRECADEDTRKRVSYVTSQNAEISSLL